MLDFTPFSLWIHQISSYLTLFPFHNSVAIPGNHTVPAICFELSLPQFLDSQLWLDVFNDKFSQHQCVSWERHRPCHNSECRAEKERGKRPLAASGEPPPRRSALFPPLLAKRSFARPIALWQWREGGRWRRCGPQYLRDRSLTWQKFNW